jgi:predicted dienelactone hydrolase
MNVGLREVALHDELQDARIRLRLVYPTEATPHEQRVGPYTLEVAVDAPLARPAQPTAQGAARALPLLVISHGTGGSALVYRDLALGLVQAGFVVALPDHPGNCRGDNALAGTAANLENRPRHIREVIDAAFADGVVGAYLQPRAVGLVGHSMGGYTALAVAGGRPSAFPRETADGLAHLVRVEPDPRVKALVLLAPATVWFGGDGALNDVIAPILLFTAETDEHTPPEHADILVRGIRSVPGHAPLEHRVVPGAGHFSFLSPFGPRLTRPEFPPSQDPAGFDRAAFQPVLAQATAEFFRRVLPPA